MIPWHNHCLGLRPNLDSWSNIQWWIQIIGNRVWIRKKNIDKLTNQNTNNKIFTLKNVEHVNLKWAKEKKSNKIQLRNFANLRRMLRVKNLEVSNLCFKVKISSSLRHWVTKVCHFQHQQLYQWVIGIPTNYFRHWC